MIYVLHFRSNNQRLACHAVSAFAELLVLHKAMTIKPHLHLCPSARSQFTKNHMDVGND